MSPSSRKKDQEIELGAPGGISEVSAVGGDASIKNMGHKNTRKVSVRGGEQVTIHMTTVG